MQLLGKLEHPTYTVNALNTFTNMNRFVIYYRFLLPAEKEVCNASRVFAEKSEWPSVILVWLSPPGSLKQKSVGELQKKEQNN